MRGLSPVLVVAMLACGGRVNVPPSPVVPVATQPPPVPPVPTLRLPTGIRPTGYVLDLSLDPGIEAFQGTVDIGLALPPGTAFVWLNAKDITVTAASLKAGVEQIPVTAHPDGKEYLGFAFARAATGPATLHIAYTGVVRTRCCGLYRDQTGEDRYLFTQFEETDARRMVPCFDEPSYKAPWQVTVHVPKGLLAFSNTRITDEGDEPDGRHRVAFARTRPLPSYLLALAVGPFETLDAGTVGTNKTPLRIIAPRGRAAEAAYVVSIFPEVMRRLEAYFGIPYPYDKLDDVATPLGFGGAMENAGLIISGNSVLLADKANLSEDFRETTASVLAHEAAHQWFGDLVTMAWWDDVWLNEAFASWMAAKVYNVKAEFVPEVERADNRRRAMVADVFATARQIRQPIRSADDIRNAFDDITYKKGATVIAMFEHAIGVEKFQKGVHDYLEAHADKTATTADFLQAISAGAGADVAPAFSTFLDQPGLPAVKLKVSCTGGKGQVELAQSRYVPVGSAAQQAAWQIPVCIKAGAGKRSATPCTTLAGPTASMALDFCPAWVHGNALGVGYYTTVFDGDTLPKVLAAADRLDLAEQLALVADLEVQLVGGTLPADRGLDAIARLAKSAPPDVLAQLAEIVDEIQDRGLVPGAQAGQFAAWVERVFGPRAKALSWKPKAGESAAVKRLRGPLLEIVALHGRDKPLRDQARALANRWLGDRKAVDADVLPSVLRVAAWTADEPFVNRVLAALPKASGQERERLVRTVFQFNDPELTGRAAQALLGDDMRGFELWSLDRIALTGGARAAMFRFVREHFDALSAKLGDYSALLLSSGRPLCDAESLAAYQQFFSDRAPRMPGGPRRYAHLVERAELCSAARKAQEQPMATYFKGK